MAHIYRVHYTEGVRDPGFPLAMKVPRMTAGDGAENIVSFEVEHQIMQVLSGSHVPRFVAAGDLETVPYLVMEYINGRTLEHWLETPERPRADELARLGAALALAVHSLHQQNTGHLELKPARRQRGVAGLWPVVQRALPRSAGRTVAQSGGVARLDCAGTSSGRAG
jgi:hypothetical protein